MEDQNLKTQAEPVTNTAVSEVKSSVSSATQESENTTPEWMGEAEGETKPRVSKSKTVKGRKKSKGPVKIVKRGRAYIQATYNNTIITLTDSNGNSLSWCSAGVLGFKGPKKSTPYAAGLIVKNATDAAKERGLEEISVYVKGVGMGREAAIRALYANGLNILSIKDVTPVPHNGCRRRKRRRV